MTATAPSPFETPDAPMLPGENRAGYYKRVFGSSAANAEAKRLHELQQREAEYEQRAKEADPAYWQEKATAARQNADELEQRQIADRKRLAAGAREAATAFAEAQQAYLDDVTAWTLAASMYLARAEDYAKAMSAARAAGAELPERVQSIEEIASRLDERSRAIKHLIQSAVALGIPTK